MDNSLKALISPAFQRAKAVRISRRESHCREPSDWALPTWTPTPRESPDAATVGKEPKGSSFKAQGLGLPWAGLGLAQDNFNPGS